MLESNFAKEEKKRNSLENKCQKNVNNQKQLVRNMN